jgi:hypothetical protein
MRQSSTVIKTVCASLKGGEPLSLTRTVAIRGPAPQAGRPCGVGRTFGNGDDSSASL